MLYFFMKKHFKHKLENLLVVDKIVTIHFFEFDKNFSYGPESHDFWEIVYADKENIVCTADGKQIILNQGQMLFHKPNEVHSLSSNGHKAPDVFIASFVCRSEAMRFFENKIVSLNKNQIRNVYTILDSAKKTFDIPYSDPDMKKMTLLSHPILGGEQLLKNYLEILLIDIMNSLTQTEQGNKTFLTDNELGNKLVLDVIKLLNDNVYENLNIDRISKITSYSKAYISRQFKLATGKGVIEYYTDLKIKVAKKLLRENELSVKEIAEKLSFDTPNYFSKTFKKLCKTTPTAYKKRTIR